MVSKARCSSSEASWTRGASSQSTALSRSWSGGTFRCFGCSWTSRIISPPMTQQLSRCRRTVLDVRPSETRWAIKGLNSATSPRPMGMSASEPFQLWGQGSMSAKSALIFIDVLRFGIVDGMLKHLVFCEYCLLPLMSLLCFMARYRFPSSPRPDEPRLVFARRAGDEGDPFIGVAFPRLRRLRPDYSFLAHTSFFPAIDSCV